MIQQELPSMPRDTREHVVSPTGKVHIVNSFEIAGTLYETKCGCIGWYEDEINNVLVEMGWYYTNNPVTCKNCLR